MTGGRKILDVTITAEGRDQGKVFRLTEMPALKAERWARRAFLALAKSGVTIPENIRNAGLAGLAILTLKALGGLDPDVADELMDEMQGCIKIVPVPEKPEVARPFREEDIQEISTILKLRVDIFELHTGFTLSDFRSKLTLETKSPESSDTPISQDP